jgi:hypothetical protein
MQKCCIAVRFKATGTGEKKWAGKIKTTWLGRDTTFVMGHEYEDTKGKIKEKKVCYICAYLSIFHEKNCYTFFGACAGGGSLACQPKTKPDLQARRDSIRVDSFSRLSAVLFDTALEAEKKQVGKAKELYAKLAKDSTFWGEQARLRLAFLSVKEVKEYIAKGILGTWKAIHSKSNWSKIIYDFKDIENEVLKIYADGSFEWVRKDGRKHKNSYKIHGGGLEPMPDKNPTLLNNPFRCLISFDNVGTFLVTKDNFFMSIRPYTCSDCSEIFYKRVE